MARSFKSNLDLPKEDAEKLKAAVREHARAGGPPINFNSENFPASATPRQKEMLGRAIQYLATHQGLFQADIARKAGISKQLVSAYWNGKSWPNHVNASKLAQALGASRDDLFPDHAITAMTGAPASISVKNADKAGFMLIELSAILPTKTVITIQELVNATHRK